MAEKASYTHFERLEFPKKEQTTCRHHRERQLEFYCRKCDDLCCDECLSTYHESHSVRNLSDIIPEKKRGIQSLIERIEKTDLVLIHDYISSTETQLLDNATYFDKLATELESQTRKLKEELDLLSAQTLSVYSQMKEDNTRRLQLYKQDLEIYEEQLKQQLRDSESLLHNGTPQEIYYKGCKSHYDEVFPFKPTLRTASFKANGNYMFYLQQALGNVTTEQKNTSNEPKQASSEANTFEDKSVAENDTESESPYDYASRVRNESEGLTFEDRSVDEQDTVSNSAYAYALRVRRESEGSDSNVDLPQPVVSSQIHVLKAFQSPRMISSICHTSDCKVWISYFNSRSVALMDKDGHMAGVMRHNVNIKDISVAPSNDALWTCHTQDRKVMELVSDKLEKRFETKKEPTCLCVTACNHVIVGMVKNVTKFTKKGKVVLTALVPGTKKPLVYTPLRICECPVTHNIAVIDEDFKEHGGTGKRNIVVMDTEFRGLYRYRGETPGLYVHGAEPETHTFVCYGIVYDSQGNLIVSDHNNKRIVLVNSRGEFVKILHKDRHLAWAVGVSKEGVVFGVFNRDRVRLIKY